MSSVMILWRAARLRGVAQHAAIPSRPSLTRLPPCRLQTTVAPTARQHDTERNATLRRRRTARRFPKSLPFSPNAALALRVKSRNSPLTWQKWKMFREAAESRSLRLPIMTLQHAMRKDEAEVQTSLSECLGDMGEWRARLNSLAFKGISEADLDRWYWILSAEDGDAKIERFASALGHKPIFVLFQLLNRDETIVKGRSLMTLIDYIAQQHCQWRSLKSDDHLSWGATRRTLDNSLNMTPEHFCILLRRLVYHCMRVWPSAIVTIARLVSTYIESIPETTIPKKTDRRSGYAARCFVFNHALQLFHQQAASNPLVQRRHNWKAQKILLAFSMRLKRPLVIDKNSFRAIRGVMVGLAKSDAERKVATRVTKTWPPYRDVWDGLDERRKPEDDLSRSVKAGFLKREAGYGDESGDRTLGVLGGAVADEGPYIQTRSLPVRTWKGSLAALNVFSDWAARVKATRNAHEAWQIFIKPPRPRLKPNFQIYAEMFEKMVAEEARSPDTLPGDNKAVFPVHDVNLSEFERARLRPPSIQDLYTRMLRDGNRPVGKCLVILIHHASSLEAALQYLQDSPLDKAAVSELTSPHIEQYTSLFKIPLPVFNAYISLLCRLQPTTRMRLTRDGRETSPALYRCLHHALRLAGKRLSARFVPQFAAPWHSIMQALARHNTVLNPRWSQQDNDAEALGLSLRVFARVKATSGLDVTAFHYLSGVLRKALKWGNEQTAAGSNGVRATGESSINGTRRPDTAQLAQQAHADLKDAFRELTAPAEPEDAAGRGLEVPALYHDVGAAHLHSYVRTLGALGDVDEMVRVVEWTLGAWDLDGALDDARDPAHRENEEVTRAFAFFRAFAGELVPDGVMRRMEERLRGLCEEKGCTWRWPDQADVQHYIERDAQRRGGRRMRTGGSALL